MKPVKGPSKWAPGELADQRQILRTDQFYYRGIDAFGNNFSFSIPMKILITGQKNDKEWLIVEKEKFDSEYDKDKDGKLNSDEIISWVVPSNQ